MKKIKPNENIIVGDWIVTEDGVKGDIVCRRIEWLVNYVLREIGYSKKYGAWETLYLDPGDGRYWVKTYPKSNMHGGGPPTLKNITEYEIRESYNLNNELNSCS